MKPVLRTSGAMVGAGAYRADSRRAFGGLAIRPIFHDNEELVEAHIVLAYRLQVKLKTLAGGTPLREVRVKLKAIQMMNVHLPSTDGCKLTLSRYSRPEPGHRMLLDRLCLSLPNQPPPKITAAQVRPTTPELAL